MTTTAVYVSNADSGEISVLHLNARSGALALAQRVKVSGIVMPPAPGPARIGAACTRRAAPSRGPS
jgi:6-phosphogluconolactonase